MQAYLIDVGDNDKWSGTTPNMWRQVKNEYTYLPSG